MDPSIFNTFAVFKNKVWIKILSVYVSIILFSNFGSMIDTMYGNLSTKHTVNYLYLLVEYKYYLC